MFSHGGVVRLLLLIQFLCTQAHTTTTTDGEMRKDNNADAIEQCMPQPNSPCSADSGHTGDDRYTESVHQAAADIHDSNESSEVKMKAKMETSRKRQHQPFDSCEEGYTECPGNGKCIPEEWVCDVWDDCGDASDELSCEGSYETFLGFDRDGSGEICFRELRIIIHSQFPDLDVSERQLDALIRDADDNGSESVDWGEFAALTALMNMVFRGDQLSRQVYTVFKALDRSADKRLDLDEMAGYIKHLGLDMTTQEISQEIRDFDLDSDQEMNFKEFVQMMRTTALDGIPEDI